MSGTITIEQGNAIFQLKGVDKILAIKSRLVITLKHIKSVSTEKVAWDYNKMMKIAGARLPGIVEDGRFLSKEGLLFYQMRNPDSCITVELKDERYKKIVFEVKDKDATAKDLRASLPWG